MICEDIRIALSEGEICRETFEGARVITHCLYPSFEPVEVVVTRFGHGFRVSDGGGAAHSAWLHGRSDLNKVMARECARYGVVCKDGVVTGEATNAEWLRSIILAVANASAAAANAALERVAVAAEKVLAERIFEELKKVVPEKRLAREFEHRGTSGKRWKYDFAALGEEHLLLVSAVSPHHVSISAKYVAFADVGANDNANKLAIFGRKLETSDIALITQVATLAPVKAIIRYAQTALAI